MFRSSCAGAHACVRGSSFRPRSAPSNVVVAEGKDDDEDENQNYSSEASEGEANQDISDNIGTQANHSPPTDGPPTIPFDNAVLNMDDLRQRRIERFS